MLFNLDFTIIHGVQKILFVATKIKDLFLNRTDHSLI